MIKKSKNKSKGKKSKSIVKAKKQQVADKNLISTGVDKLLDYIATKGKAGWQELVEKSSVSEDVLTIWMDALVNEGIIEKEYSAQGIEFRIPDYNPKATLKSKKTNDSKEDKKPKGNIFSKLKKIFGGRKSGND